MVSDPRFLLLDARREISDGDDDARNQYRSPQKMSRELHLKSAIAQLEAGEIDIVISELSSSSVEKVWVAILEMVKSTSEVVSAMLPNFWRISKGFMEGKFKRVREYCLFDRLLLFFFLSFFPPHFNFEADLDLFVCSLAHD